MQHVDLFCGAGGMSLGLANAGITPIGAYDHSDPALETYRHNIGPHAWPADLSDPASVIAAIKRLNPDALSGGPPCQDFSSAGPRRAGARAALTGAFARIVAAVRPSWVLMENVAPATRSAEYQAAVRLLRDQGYGLTIMVLDASRCGVPQRRKRAICVGRLEQPDDFLKEHLLSGLAPRPMTVRDYFGDDLPFEHYYVHPRNYDRRAVFPVTEPAPTMRGTSRNPAPGYVRHPRDSADPRQVRGLDPHWRGRIQTFPKKWVWKGSKGQVEQMIGNAVPPQLAAYIGRAIVAYERELQARLLRSAA